MKKQYIQQLGSLIWLCLACLQAEAGYAQSAMRGDGFSGGSWVSNTTMSAGAGTSQIITRTPAGTGNRYFRFVSSGNQISPSASCTAGDDLNVTTSVHNVINAANTNCTNGAWFINCPNTTDNYIFKTPSSTSTQFVYFRVQGTVITVSSVTRSPSTTIYPGVDVTITANLSGGLSTGQAVYLRYTKDAFATSTVVQMTGSGTVYESTIPALFNTPSANVVYYVFTSGTANVDTNGSNADFYTINLNNNSGSNYSYTVASNYTTANDGNWDNGSTWVAGFVPPTGQPVVIAHNVTVANADVSTTAITINSSRTLTINSSRTLSANGTITNNGTLQVNGSLRINTGGSVSGSRPTYATNSTLVYGGTLTIGNEWLDNTDTGTGIPHHVTIATGAVVNYPSSGTYRQMNGNMTIQGSLTMPSASIGSDIRLRGNWHRTSAGVFNCDARAIFFNGSSATQTISCDATGGEKFDVLIIQNTVQIQSNVTIRNNWGTRRLWLDSGTLTRSGSQTLTIENDVLIERRIGTLDFVPTISGTDRIRILYNGNTAITTGNEVPTNPTNNLGRITIQNTAGVTLQNNLAGSSNTTIVVGQDSGTSPGGASLNSTPYTTSGGTGIFIMNDKEYSGAGVFTFNGGRVELTHTNGISGIIQNTGTRNFTAGTFRFNRGAAQNFGTITSLDNMNIELTTTDTYVTLNSSPTIRSLNIGTGTTFTASDATARILTITIPASQTSLTNNGTWVNGVTDTWVRFAGGSGRVHTISGTFNFLNVETNGNTGINFGANAAIINSGTFRINNGGFVSTNSPTYNTGSTLLYWVNTTFGRSDEWGTTRLPHHVRLGNNTTLNLASASTLKGNMTIDAGSNLTLSGTGDLTIEGNLIVDGSLTPVQRTVTFGGTSTQTISGTTAQINFYNMTINANATVQLLRNINFIDFSTNCGTMTINNGGTLDAQNFQIFGTNACSGNVNFNINGTLRTTRQEGLFGASNTTIDNSKTALTLNINSTIEYYRNGDQTVTARTDYGNVIISTSGNKSLAGNSTIRNTLTLNAGTLSVGNNTLTFHTGNTPIARDGTTQTGQITMASNSSLAFGATGNTAGNAFTLPNSVFSGTGTISFQNLTIIRTNDIAMSNQDFALSGTLSVGGSSTGGDFNLNGRFVNLGTTGQITEDLPNNALITDKTTGLNDSNQGGYLIFDARNVTGTQSNIGGSALLLNRIGGSDFTINFRRYHYKAGGAFPFGSIWKVYSISVASGSFTDLRMRINYATQELAGLPDDSSLKLFRWSNSVAPIGWTNQGGTRTAGTPSYVERASGITTFSTWTIGSENTPLRPELTLFEAQQIQDAEVQLTWQGNFGNATGFIVEKSINNLDFQPISQLDHQLNQTKYVDFDQQFYASSYYRIKVLLPQNQYFYSEVRFVAKQRIKQEVISLYPNPFAEKVYVKAPAQQSLNIEIFDLKGVSLCQAIGIATEVERQLNTYFQTAPQSAYIVRIVSEGKVWTQKLIKH